MTILPHEVSVAELAASLAMLRQGLRIVPNKVGNLAILGDDYAFLGYLDLGDHARVVLELNGNAEEEP